MKAKSQVAARSSRARGGVAEVNRGFRHTVRPGINSVMYLKTMPGAVCHLRSDQGHPRAKARVKYFADDQGIISVHVRPAGESEKAAKFVIDCELDGEVARYPLELRASHNDSAEAPFPNRQRPPRKKRGSIRPGLPAKEALRLSKKELLARGYPPRPSSKAVGPLQTWLRAVSAPAVNITPMLVTNPGVRHVVSASVAETAANWSGFELSGLDFFDQVWGEWNVPWILLGESVEPFTASAFWVGIDGDNTSDLVQAGTEQDNVTFDWFGNLYSFSSYYAWTEVLPQQPSEQVISNLPVNPGDQMLVFVGYDISNSTANLFVQNNTSNEYVFVPVQVDTLVPGFTAEWIMERPTYNGSLTDLAVYQLAFMSSAFAVAGPPSPGGILTYQGTVLDSGVAPLPPTQSNQITMTNGPDVLSRVFPLDELSMYFIWSNFH